MKKKIIYLNYKQYYSYMNIAHSHRTSNGFKYSCYDAIETTGPFFSEELPQFDDADKALMLSITNTPIGEKITWKMMIVGQSLFVGNHEIIIIATMIAEFVLS